MLGNNTPKCLQRVLKVCPVSSGEDDIKWSVFCWQDPRGARRNSNTLQHERDSSISINNPFPSFESQAGSRADVSVLTLMCANVCP